MLESGLQSLSYAEKVPLATSSFSWPNFPPKQNEAAGSGTGTLTTLQAVKQAQHNSSGPRGGGLHHGDEEKKPLDLLSLEGQVTDSLLGPRQSPGPAGRGFARGLLCTVYLS